MINFDYPKNFLERGRNLKCPNMIHFKMPHLKCRDQKVGDGA